MPAFPACVPVAFLWERDAIEVAGRFEKFKLLHSHLLLYIIKTYIFKDVWLKLSDQADKIITMPSKKPLTKKDQNIEVRPQPSHSAGPDSLHVSNGMDEAIIITTEHGNILDWSAGAEKLFGYTARRATGKPLSKFIPSLRQREITEIIKKAKNGSSVSRFEQILTDKDGKDFTAQLGIILIRPPGTNCLLCTIRNISREKKEQAELRRCLNFVESVEEGCFETDLAGNITFANEAAVRRTGHTRYELIGLNYRKYTSPEESKKIAAIFNEIYKTGNAAVVDDLEVIDKSGNVRYLELSVSLMRDSEGSPVGFRGTSRDVTSDKKTHQAVQKNEARYRNMFEYNAAVMLLINEESQRIVDANQAACTYYGYSKEELLKKKISDIIVAERETLSGTWNGAGHDGHSGVLLQHRLASGEPRPVEVFSGPVGIDGQPLAYLIVHDISERRAAEKKLVASEEKYRTIIEGMVDGYFENDLNGRFTFANEVTCQTLGYSLDELVKFDYRKFTTSESAKKIREIYTQTLKTGIPSTLVDYEIIRRNGTILTHQLNVSLMRDAGGKPMGFRSVSRDITRRKQAEEALRASEEKYRGILENITEAYFESDSRGRFTFVNDAACVLTGRDREELLKIELRDFTTPETRQKMIEAYRSVYQTGEPIHINDYEFVHRDGTVRTHQVNASLMRDADGKKIGFRSVARDVTEKKKAEEELRRSEQRIRALFDNMPVPTLVWKGEADRLILQEFNEAALHFTGGKILHEVGKTPEASFTGAWHVAADMRQCLATRSPIEKSFWFKFDGTQESRYVNIKYAFTPPDNVIMHIIDVTAQKKAEEELKYISVRDALTGLYNRFYSDAEIARVSASRLRPVSFIVIDLNDLKGINDRRGHAAGDLYIKNTADMLKQTFRPEDMIARTGGDEFLIMLPLVDESTCRQAVERLKHNLERFNQTTDQPVSMAAGFATSRTGNDVAKVIALADRMMYREKAKMKEEGSGICSY